MFILNLTSGSIFREYYRLTGKGTPIDHGNHVYTVGSNSTIDNTICPVNVRVVPKTFKIFNNSKNNYGMGSGNWNTILSNKNNFGPEGTVKVGDINVKSISSNNQGSIREDLDNFKPDLIVVGYSYSNKAGTVRTMYDYAREHNVPIIVAVEHYEMDFINHAYPGVFSLGGGISGNFTLNEEVAPDDVLRFGPFGDVNTITKNGHGDNWLDYYDSELPSTIIPYMRWGDSTIGVFRDDSQRLIYCPDGGVLEAARHSGGTPTNDTAKFFANAVYWAMQFD